MKRVRDKFTYNFWIKQEITESDVGRFVFEKILWNQKKVKLNRADIDRLVAFQQACIDTGKTDLFKRVEKKLAQELTSRAG